MSVKHQNKKAVELWAKEIAAAGTGGTPGITAAVGGRPKPSPCLKLFSFLHPKDKVDASVNIDDKSEIYRAQKFDEQPVEDLAVQQIGEISDKLLINVMNNFTSDNLPRGSCTYKLEELAFTRSGDKVGLFSIISTRIFSLYHRVILATLG